jgi:RimK family alpha-L-glutamate ligase
MLELLVLARRGISILNPAGALLRAHDKLVTARILTSAGVPHPETQHVTWHDRSTTLVPPVVVKPRFGSWGSDVFRCDSTAELRDTLDAIADRTWFRAHGALVQALVPPVGHDLRVLVARGRTIGAERRIAAPGEWRTNVSLGGSWEETVAPPHARALSLAAARVVSGDFVGVDLLPTGNDYVVVEVNGAVDFTEHYSLPGRDVFVDLAAALGLIPPAARRTLREPGRTALVAANA